MDRGVCTQSSAPWASSTAPKRARRFAFRSWRAKAGDKLTFDEVLLSSDGSTIRAGTPLVSGAKVQAEVVGEGKEPKIYVFKFKRRKNYRRKTGHRQKFTEVRVTDLTLG